MNLLPIILLAIAGDMPPDASKQELPDNSDVPSENRLPALGCDLASGVCLIHSDEIRVYVHRFDRAMKELDALRVSKGCAKIEVVPKKIPPLKKERDT